MKSVRRVLFVNTTKRSVPTKKESQSFLTFQMLALETWWLSWSDVKEREREPNFSLHRTQDAAQLAGRLPDMNETLGSRPSTAQTKHGDAAANPGTWELKPRESKHQGHIQLLKKVKTLAQKQNKNQCVFCTASHWSDCPTNPLRTHPSGWRDGSQVKGADCLRWRFKFRSQHPQRMGWDRVLQPLQAPALVCTHPYIGSTPIHRLRGVHTTNKNVKPLKLKKQPSFQPGMVAHTCDYLQLKDTLAAWRRGNLEPGQPWIPEEHVHELFFLLCARD